MMKIGVLALQGAVREHLQAIEACGAEAVVMKNAAQLFPARRRGFPAPGTELTGNRG